MRVIAHDLNGPLTGMNLTLQACRKLASTDAMRQLLNALATDLTSATDLLEELKSLNRRDTFRMQKIDLVAEMKALIDQVQSNPRVPIFIDLVDSNEKLTIAGDISRLRRAWQNIIRNTIDTAEARKDGERVALQVSMKRSGASARIRFSDNGGGIDRRRVARVLELEALLERRVAQLSGGQQQRVALGRAMVKEPKVFLFDEPLSNLDAALRTRMRIEIKKLHQQLKTTSIFVTHDQEEAMMLSDYIAVMRNGEVVQYGPADEIYRRPQHYYVATFIGKPRMGILQGTLHAANGVLSFSADGIQIQWPQNTGARDAMIAKDQPVLLGIRAEDVGLVQGDLTQTPASFVGQIALLEPLGSDTYVEVGRAGLSLTARVEPDRRLSVGETVTLQLPREKLHFFHAETHLRLEL